MTTPTQAVLFDVVGTLIYPHPPSPRVYARLGAEYGSQLTEADVTTRFRKAFRAHTQADDDSLEREATNEPFEKERWRRIVADIFLDLPDSSRAELLGRLWSHFSDPHNWATFEDAPAAVDTVLEIATRRKLKVGLASNFDERLRSIREGVAVLSRFERLYCSSELGYPKPSPQFFRRIEADLNLPSKSILLIGDDPINDVAGAQAAGWQWRRIDRSGGSENSIRALSQVGADLEREGE
ncbi:MAG: HAD-IA family hydrolase [Pirellulaceae bacterium]|jgi:putative hydrolase of the HAD superfamily|nr:HAD-IA family hydrolase [Pirellulaceae bacterium]MDP7016168.1 HAD-IA family hydrolase [Pirellulaceae bacterium]